MDQQDGIGPQTVTNDDAKAKAETANNGDRSRVDGDGSRGEATHVMDTTIARADEWTAGCC